MGSQRVRHDWVTELNRSKTGSSTNMRDSRARRDSFKSVWTPRGGGLEQGTSASIKVPDYPRVQPEKRNLLWVLLHWSPNCQLKHIVIAQKLRVMFYLVVIFQTSSPGDSISSKLIELSWGGVVVQWGERKKGERVRLYSSLQQGIGSLDIKR